MRYLASLLILLSFAAPLWAAEGEAEGGLFSGDLGNAIWTLVIFAVVLWVLARYAWGPLLSSIQARESFIQESLQKAKQDRDEAERRLKEYADKIANARNEATAIVEEGRRDAEVVKQRIEKEARQEADQIIQRARREIEIATETAIKELYQRTGALATRAAEKIVRKELSSADHERLIRESIEELDKLQLN